MKGICPNCEKFTELECIEKREDIKVRGELIKIDTKFFKCKECEDEFEDQNSNDDPLEIAYKEYRRRHGMYQPEDIKELRKKFGLTQIEFSRLLGWGVASLSRYENGALQEEGHDRYLQLLKSPENLLKLIEINGEFLPAKKKQKILDEISASIEETCSFPNILEIRFGKYEPSIESGYKRLEITKLFETVKIFAKEGVLKSKLCKLLFYTDFKHFKDYAVSITGSKYAHGYHGPVPDNYEHYFATLIHDQKSIKVEEKEYGKYVGEEYHSIKDPNLNVFSETELEIILKVKKLFKDYTANKIKEFSHEERGYIETNDGDIISYEFANDLKI